MTARYSSPDACPVRVTMTPRNARCAELPPLTRTATFRRLAMLTRSLTLSSPIQARIVVANAAVASAIAPRAIRLRGWWANGCVTVSAGSIGDVLSVRASRSASRSCGIPSTETSLCSGAEVRGRRRATHALHPDVLNARDVRGEVVRRDEHVGRERGVLPVACSEEVGSESDSFSAGARRLQRLTRRGGALERRTWQELGRVPADTLASHAPGQRALIHGRPATEVASGADDAPVGAEGTAAGQTDSAGGSPFDVSGVEAEADVGNGRNCGGRTDHADRNCRGEHRGRTREHAGTQRVRCAHEVPPDSG